MNIDLLLTQRGEPGLLCDEDFLNPVAGAIFDAESCQMTLEFTDMDSLDLNIPVDQDFVERLLYSKSMQLGSIVDGKLSSSHQIPVVFINDPYGVLSTTPARGSHSILGFERFLQTCVTGQPIHRDDLGDEATAEAVVSGINTAVLQYAPQLARQRAMEAAPKAALDLGGGPQMNGPGGMGGGGGGSGVVRRTAATRPVSRDNRDDGATDS